MALIINGKLFSTFITNKELSIILKELSQISEVKIIYSADNHDINAENTLLCLQREMLHMHAPSEPNIKYLGTKRLSDCIFLYLYSPTDHFIVHVDPTDLSASHNFSQALAILKKINDTSNIKAMLVGGRSNVETSKKNLINILNFLIKLSNTLEINIHLDAQMVHERNMTLDGSNTQNEHTYNLIFEHLDILSRKYFKHALTLELFKEKKIDDFKNVNIIESSDFKTFTKLLIEAREVDITNKKTIISMLENQLAAYISNENYFIQMALNLFSIQGFKALSPKTPQIDPTPKLSNFVFDILTRNIYSMKKHLKTPNEIIRNAHMIDFYDPNHAYFLTHQHNTDFLPNLSPSFIEFCSTLEKDVQLNQTKNTGELLPMECSYPDSIRFRNDLFKFVKLNMETKLLKNSLLANSIFSEKQDARALYKQAVTLYNANELESAKQSFQAALVLFKQKNEILFQGRCCYSLASLHYKKNDLTQAIFFCEEAIGLFHQSSSHQDLEDSVNKLHKYLVENKSSPEIIYNQSLQLYNESKFYLSLQKLLFSAEQFKVKKSIKNLSNAYSCIASCYRKLGDIGAAIQYCDLACEILETNQIKDGLQKIQDKKAQLILLKSEKQLINF